jgi:hypothetical protein
MRRLRVLTLVALAGTAFAYAASPAWAQSQNGRLQPQPSSTTNGAHKVTGQQKRTVDAVEQAQAAKKKAENRGIGAPVKPLQRP